MSHAWWLIVAVFFAYAGSAHVLSILLGQSIDLVPAWMPGTASPTWARLVALTFGLSGIAIALVVPALAWAQVLSPRALRPAPLFHRAFALNLGQAVVFIGLWKAAQGIVPSRPMFIAWQALVTMAGLFVLMRYRSISTPRFSDGVRPVVAGGLVLLLVVPLLLWTKVFVEDASGDGTEHFEFSRSLAVNQLPHWDLENGFYGFYPSFMLFAYPTQLSFIAIGETEAGQRLPVFLYQFGVYLTLVELIRRRRRSLSWSEIGLLAGTSSVLLLYLSSHSTYEVVVDLAELTGTDTFFAFLAGAAFYELHARQRAWWGAFATLGAAALAAGLPFALLFLAGRLVSRWPRGRLAWRDNVLDWVAFAVPFAIYQAAVAVYARIHPLGSTKWSLANITDQYPMRVEPEVIGAVLFNLAIVVAAVPLLGCVFVAGRDRMTRTLGVLLVGYLGILMMFGRVHVHYVVPLCAFQIALFLRGLAAWQTESSLRGAMWAAHAAVLCLVLYLAMPSDRTPHTAYREFGAKTLMLFDRYSDVETTAEALIWNQPDLFVHLPVGKPVRPGAPTRILLASDDSSEGPVRVDAMLEDVVTERNPASTDAPPWGLSHHTWIRYADRSPVPGRRYHQLVVAPLYASGTPDGFSRRDLDGGWALFYRPGESIFTWLGAPPPQ